MDFLRLIKAPEESNTTGGFRICFLFEMITKPVNTEQLLPINPGDYHENIHI